MQPAIMMKTNTSTFTPVITVLMTADSFTPNARTPEIRKEKGRQIQNTNIRTMKKRDLTGQQHNYPGGVEVGVRGQAVRLHRGMLLQSSSNNVVQEVIEGPGPGFGHTGGS